MITVSLSIFSSFSTANDKIIKVRQAKRILAQARDETYSNHFGTGVMRRTAAGFQHGAGRLQRRHSEIRYLDIILLVQQQIFRLQVSVTEKEKPTTRLHRVVRSMSIIPIIRLSGKYLSYKRETESVKCRGVYLDRRKWIVRNSTK